MSRHAGSRERGPPLPRACTEAPRPMDGNECRWRSAPSICAGRLALQKLDCQQLNLNESMTTTMQISDISLPDADDSDQKTVKRLAAQTLADRACDMLDQAILNGELPPGTQFSEAELA